VVMCIVMLPSPEGDVVAREDQLGHLEGEFFVGADGQVLCRHPWDHRLYFVDRDLVKFRGAVAAFNRYNEDVVGRPGATTGDSFRAEGARRNGRSPQPVAACPLATAGPYCPRASAPGGGRREARNWGASLALRAASDRQKSREAPELNVRLRVTDSGPSDPPQPPLLIEPPVRVALVACHPAVAPDPAEPD
jgi:hypothetical protein